MVGWAVQVTQLVLVCKVSMPMPAPLPLPLALPLFLPLVLALSPPLVLVVEEVVGLRVDAETAMGLAAPQGLLLCLGLCRLRLCLHLLLVVWMAGHQRPSQPHPHPHPLASPRSRCPSQQLCWQKVGSVEWRPRLQPLPPLHPAPLILGAPPSMGREPRHALVPSLASQTYSPTVAS